jgi:P pilus assembly chaperone PapD
MLLYPKPQLTAIRMAFVFLIAGMFTMGVESAKSQISIAPTAVFMSDRSPFANVIVSNGSETAQEITIGFRFGYSISDKEGNISMLYDTTGHASSLTNNVNAFPRHFVLQPGQRQTVRLAARGYGQKDDGTYWSRVNILASPLSPPIEADMGNEAVAARININFEQVIPAFFKKGDVSTGLEVGDIRFTRESDRGTFLIEAERTGNSPYIGSTYVSIRDQRDEIIMEQDVSFSTYFDINRRINLDMSELTPGTYTADFHFRTTRRDISSSNLIQADPFTISKEFSIE